MQMRERNIESRVDETYPFERVDEMGNPIETLQQPPVFDVKFIYSKGRRGQPNFRIFAHRIDKESEQYEIDIVGHKRIKAVMK